MMQLIFAPSRPHECDVLISGTVGSNEKEAPKKAASLLGLGDRLEKYEQISEH